MIDYKDFGHRVRTLRREKHMTQETLAEAAGISTSFLGHIERGTRVASIETLVLLSNALQTHPNYLLEASLEDDISRLLPRNLSPVRRAKLSAFLRMTDDMITTMEDSDLDL